VALAIALGSIVSSLGIVNFGGLLGFGEPAEERSTKTRVAKHLPARKPAHVAVKPSQKAATPSAPQVNASGKPLETTTPYAFSDVVQRRPRAAAPRQTRLSTRQSTSPPPSTQKPAVSQTPPAPAPLAQKPIVPQKPAAPKPSRPKSAVAPKTAAAATPAQKPVVAQAPQPDAATQKRETRGGEEPFPEETVSPRPYSVYLGSYKTTERADQAISQYKNKGVTGYWVEVDLGAKGVWYRVFTGHFRDKKEAQAFIAQKRLEEGEVKKTRYAALIGVYVTEDDLRKESLDLSRLGYSPYVIEAEGGEAHLYVGAFYTKAGAEKQRTNLASKGIKSRVVER
jgi:hypothetical protein